MVYTQEIEKLMLIARPDIDVYDEIIITDNSDNLLEMRDATGELLAEPFALNVPLRQRDIERAFAEASQLSQSVAQRSVTSFSASSYDPLREMGLMLYRNLFEGRRGVIFERKVSIARSRSQGVRLNFEFQDEACADLPWEILHDENNFICLSSAVQVARRLPGAQKREYHPLERVNVLIVTLDDSADNLVKHIDLVRDQIANGLGKTLMTDIKVISAEELPNHLGSVNYDLLHVISGRDVNRPTQSVQQINQERLLPIQSLMDSIEHQHPRLVVLQTQNSDQNARALAAECGAVVTVRSSVSVKAKEAFADGLYRSLFTQHTIDQAIAAARQEIDLQLPGSREWGLPRYYRPPVSRLPLLGVQQVAESKSAESTSINLGPPTTESNTFGHEQMRPAISKREKRMMQVRLHMEELNLDSLQKQALEYRAVPNALQRQIQETQSTISRLQEQLY